jgi:hypothetical protein
MRRKRVMVVVLCALLLFGALSITDFSVEQQKALADEATFYSTASDGFLELGNVSYSAVHDAVNAAWVRGSFPILAIGQAWTGSNYFIQRGALFFDTSSLPDSAVITSATLSLYGYFNESETDFDITVVDGSLLNDPLVASDYGDLLNQTTSGGAFNTAGFSTSGYNDILLNAVGMGWISKTGVTKLGLRNSNDITATAPVNFEHVGVHPSESEAGVGYRPMLVVNYEYPTASVPTLSQWGMIGMAIVLAAFLVWSVRKRWVVSTDRS